MLVGASAMKITESFNLLACQLAELYVRFEDAGLDDLAREFLQLMEAAGIVVDRKGNRVTWQLRDSEVGGVLQFHYHRG